MVLGKRKYFLYLFGTIILPLFYGGFRGKIEQFCRKQEDFFVKI